MQSAFAIIRKTDNAKRRKSDMSKRPPAHFRLILLTLALAASIGGCATAPPPEVKAPDESAAMLTKAIAASDAQMTHTASADAKAPPARMNGAQMSINYAGEGRVLLKTIAAARGLTFAVRGPQPHLPLFVIVDAQNVSFEEFLSDVAAQFGQRASLALTDASIEVRYRE